MLIKSAKISHLATSVQCYIHLNKSIYRRIWQLIINIGAGIDETRGSAGISALALYIGGGLLLLPRLQSVTFICTLPLSLSLSLRFAVTISARSDIAERNIQIHGAHDGSHVCFV